MPVGLLEELELLWELKLGGTRIPGSIDTQRDPVLISGSIFSTYSSHDQGKVLSHSEFQFICC